VTSVAGRTGAVTLANTDISGLGTMSTATAADYSTTTAANGLYYPLSSNPAGYLTTAPVTSVAGRTGAVTLSTSDISGLGTAATFADTAFLKTANNLSELTATASTARTNLGLGTMATATAADYSTTTAANALYYPLSSNPAGYLTSAPVTSVAGKTGVVTLVAADVSGAAPLASPALTGTPTAPTATGGTNTTQIATTAFVTAAIPTNNVKAWVNFNGTGTVAIRASMNVSSITDNGTGSYTVNFTTALADANYAAAGFTAESTFSVAITVGNFGTLTQTTTAFRFNTTYGTTFYDCTQVHMTIHR
jgi:hypothetical protein